MLYNQIGNRKYLTDQERRRFINAAHSQCAAVETFCLTLAYTGGRITVLYGQQCAGERRYGP